MDWSRMARETIAKIHASLPEDATLAERKRALKDGYPFGEREYWPYKAWCKAKRKYLARFEPYKPPPGHLFADDIIFPYRTNTDTE